MAEATERGSLLAEWQVSTLRATFFAVQPKSPAEYAAHVSQWWTSAVGEEPEQTASSKMGGSKAEGPFGGHALSLEVMGARINWEWVTVLDLDKPGAGPPIMGSFLSRRDEFLHAIGKWLPTAPPCVRIAFGAQLLLSKETKAESYAQLSSLLPFRVDAETEGDLLFTINRYATSSVGPPGLRINRLRKWGGVVFRLRAGAPGQRPDVVYDRHGCFLELDISTDAERDTELPADNRRELFEELAQVGTDIAAKGDRG